MVRVSLLSEEIFERNAAVLKAVNPALFKAVMETELDVSDYEILASRKDGLPTVGVKKDGRFHRLHSYYSPSEEAKRIISSIKFGKKIYIFFGMGLGYLLDEFLDVSPIESFGFVVEPSLEIFKLAMYLRDLRKFITSMRLTFAVGMREEDVLASYKLCISRVGMSDNEVISLPGERGLFQPYWKHLLSLIKDWYMSESGNLATTVGMGHLYLYNSVLNLPRSLVKPPLGVFRNVFRGLPAVIVSAGPSLDKNKELLFDVGDKAVVVAVDTSLKPLLSMDYEPHLVCTGDPQFANYRHLQGAGERVKKSYLLTELMGFPAVFDEFDKIIVTVYEGSTANIIFPDLPDFGRISVWGSVATMAFSAAVFLGCDPIIFIGQDLSYSGGRTYTKGTYFEEEEKMKMTVEELLAKGVPLIKLEDIYGNTVYTNRQMYQYYRWFLDEFKKYPHLRIVNATEGGILKGDGIEITTFREAIEKYIADSPGGVLERLEEGYEKGVKKNYPYIRHYRERYDRYVEELQRVESVLGKKVRWVEKMLKEVQTGEMSPELVAKEVQRDAGELDTKLFVEKSLYELLKNLNFPLHMNYWEKYLTTPQSKVDVLTAVQLCSSYLVLLARLRGWVQTMEKFFQKGKAFFS